MEVNKNKIRQILEGNGTYREKYYQIYGEWVHKDVARYRINKLYRSCGRNNNTVKVLDEVALQPKNSCCVVINEDNTQSSQKLLNCSLEEMKDPLFLLNAHGYDPNRFELVSAASSMWQNGSDDNTTLYASKIKVRPLEDETLVLKNIDKCIQLAFKDNQMPRAKKYVKKKSNIQLPGGYTEKDNLLEFCIPDLHIGLSENEEGELSLAYNEERVNDKSDEMCRIIRSTDCSHVVIAFLGDLLHYDTAHKTTTKGTQQCSNVSFEHTFSSAIRIVHNMIDSVVGTMLEKYKDTDDCFSVHVIYIPGNHDTILGYTLMSVIKAYFYDNEFISFDIRQMNRKYLHYGNNLIGFIHGDMNPKRLNQWLYSEARQCISDSSSIEIHCGHLHSEQVVEDNGVIVRHLPTTCGVSPWEHQQGFHAKRRLTAFVWNAVDGLKQILYF